LSEESCDLGSSLLGYVEATVLVLSLSRFCLSDRVGLKDFLPGDKGDCELKFSSLSTTLSRSGMDHFMPDRVNSLEYISRTGRARM
jgi:hypothetical protein